jgi:hypothetical protein
LGRKQKGRRGYRIPAIPVTNSSPKEVTSADFRAIILAEDPAMERFIQLNLHSDREKAEAENLPKTENRDPAEVEKKLKRLARTAAHKAAKEYSRSGTGVFSK